MDADEVVEESTTEEVATEGDELSDDVLMARQEETTTEESQADQAIEIGGTRYELPELEELLVLAKDAKEVKAESTKRFQEASDLRKKFEGFEQLASAWESGPEGRAAIIKNLQEQDRQLSGGIPNQPESEIPWEDMTPNEQFLYRQIMATRQENARLRSELAPTLQEVSSFVGQTKAEKENIAMAQAITAKYGDVMTPEQVAEMRAKGIADPVEAYGYFRPKFQESFAKGHEQASKPKVETPSVNRSKVFDDSEMGVDEIFFNRQKGLIPASTLK